MESDYRMPTQLFILLCKKNDRQICWRCKTEFDGEERLFNRACGRLEKNQIFSKNEIAKILEYSLYTAKAGKVKLRDMEVVMAVK